MKIISHTSDEVVLKDSNYWGITIVVFGLLVTLFLNFGLGSGNSIIGDVIYWVILVVAGVGILFMNP